MRWLAGAALAGYAASVACLIDPGDDGETTAQTGTAINTTGGGTYAQGGAGPLGGIDSPGPTGGAGGLSGAAGAGGATGGFGGAGGAGGAFGGAGGAGGG